MLRILQTLATALLLVAGPSAIIARGQPPREASADLFLVRAEFPIENQATLMRELAEIQTQLENVLGLEKPHESIELILFRNEASYRAWMRARFPQVPFRRAMFVKDNGPGAVYAYRNPELATDLRHEGTHGLLHASLPMVPLWLDEGIAEYYEVPAAQRVHGNPHQKVIARNVWIGVVPSLVKLEQRTGVAEMAAADYRESWAWVHFMLHGPDAARQELVAFLSDIQHGAPPGTLSARLQMRLGPLDVQLAHHFKHWGR